MSDVINIERAAEELAKARRAVRANRRAFWTAPVSAFVRVMQGAIAQYLEARQQGVSREDGIKGIEAELRDAWPKNVSKFAPVCGACDDTGWIDRVCWDRARCGREVCAKNPERQHAYVDPCGCVAGDRMRKKVQTTEDALAAAGRTSKRKPRGWRQAGA